VIFEKTLSERATTASIKLASFVGLLVACLVVSGFLQAAGLDYAIPLVVIGGAVGAYALVYLGRSRIGDKPKVRQRRK
jgi:hypothetical protein